MFRHERSYMWENALTDRRCQTHSEPALNILAGGKLRPRSSEHNATLLQYRTHSRRAEVYSVTVRHKERRGRTEQNTHTTSANICGRPPSRKTCKEGGIARWAGQLGRWKAHNWNSQVGTAGEPSALCCSSGIMCAAWAS